MKRSIDWLVTSKRRKGHSVPRAFAVLSVATLSAVGALYASTASAKPKAQPATGPEGSAKASLVVQLWGETTTFDNIWKTYIKDYPRDAQKQTLKEYSAGANDAASVAKLRLELTSGKNIPDFLLLNSNEIPEFANKLTNLAPYIKSYLPGMTIAARKAMTYQGQYIGIPYQLLEKLWFYRKDLFQQAGIDVTTIKTQDDFIAAGKKLHAMFPSDFIWNLASSPQQYILTELTSGNGTQFFNQKTGKWIVTTNPGIRNAFITLAQLRASGVVDTTFDDFTPQWQAGLASGAVASVPVQNWMAEFLPQYAPKLAGEWGVTTWPSLGGDPNGAGSGGGGTIIVFPKGVPTTNTAAAVRFVIDMFMTARGSLANYHISQAVPSVTAALNSPAAAKNSYFGPALINAYKAASKSFSVPIYDPAAYQENVIIVNALDTFLASGSLDPTSALQTAQSEMQAQIGNPYKH